MKEFIKNKLSYINLYQKRMLIPIVSNGIICFDLIFKFKKINY